MPSLEIADRSAFKSRMKEVLEFDKRQAVVLTIDLQREYLDESVGESVVEPDEAKRVVESNRILLDAARAEGIPVVHAYVVRESYEHAAGIYFGGLDYMKAAQDNGISQAPHRPPRTRMDRAVGTPASEVPAECVAPGDIHITDKKGLDSYLHTELGFLFSRVLKPRFVISTGINTDTCVYATTFTTANLGYSPIVVSDCVASMRGRDSHEMALELMSRSIAWVLSLDEILTLMRR
jgi:biuret amidohydrolase